MVSIIKTSLTFSTRSFDSVVSFWLRRLVKNTFTLNPAFLAHNSKPTRCRHSEYDIYCPANGGSILIQSPYASEPTGAKPSSVCNWKRIIAFHSYPVRPITPPLKGLPATQKEAVGKNDRARELNTNCWDSLLHRKGGGVPIGLNSIPCSACCTLYHDTSDLPLEAHAAAVLRSLCPQQSFTAVWLDFFR
jgi:hypothetical protein